MNVKPLEKKIMANKGQNQCEEFSPFFKRRKGITLPNIIVRGRGGRKEGDEGGTTPEFFEKNNHLFLFINTPPN